MFNLILLSSSPESDCEISVLWVTTYWSEIQSEWQHFHVAGKFYVEHTHFLQNVDYSVHSQLPSQLKNLKLVPGSPCDDLKGYCDVFAVCRRVDMAGPLARLKQQFFTVEGW